MDIERCEERREAEQVSLVEVRGYFDEEELIRALEEIKGIWSIKCLREYGSV